VNSIENEFDSLGRFEAIYFLSFVNEWEIFHLREVIFAGHGAFLCEVQACGSAVNPRDFIL
jgi:hypothetical protein